MGMAVAAAATAAAAGDLDGVTAVLLALQIDRFEATSELTIDEPRRDIRPKYSRKLFQKFSYDDRYRCPGVDSMDAMLSCFAELGL